MNAAERKEREELVAMLDTAKAVLATVTPEEMKDPEARRIILELQDAVLFGEQVLMEHDMQEAA